MNKEQLLIENYLLPLANNKESLQLKNDAALFKNKNLVISTDMMIEDQHFTKNYKPEILAKKLLRINLSDMAAMGALPYGFLLNIAIPKKNVDRWLKFFTKGLNEDMRQFNLKLFGGDLCYSKKIFLSMTILGKTKKNCHFKNFTKINSDIYVSGNIGDAALGLKLFQNRSFFDCSKTNRKKLINKLHIPEPRLDVGKKILNKVEFCTDLSDGLIEEILTVAERSKKQANIFLEKIPISKATDEVLRKNKSKEVWDMILFGGEDYELLFSMNKHAKVSVSKNKITKIGFFSKGRGVRIFDKNGVEFVSKKKGFSHF